MQILPEFFQGSITQNFRGILDAEYSRTAASGELTGKAKGPAETRAPTCKKDYPKSPGTVCTSALRCKKKSTHAPKCKDHPKTPGNVCTQAVRCKKKSTQALKCPQHPPSPGVGCTAPDRCNPKKKAAAFLPDVEGWSSPPAS